MSNKTDNADTTDATCPKCGHALWGHTEFPGLWCCFYDAALGKLCECHAPDAPTDGSAVLDDLSRKIGRIADRLATENPVNVGVSRKAQGVRNNPLPS